MTEVATLWARTKSGTSWHALQGVKTACGKTPRDEAVDDRPAGKTCESCLRIISPK